MQGVAREAIDFLAIRLRRAETDYERALSRGDVDRIRRFRLQVKAITAERDGLLRHLDKKILRKALGLPASALLGDEKATSTTNLLSNLVNGGPLGGPTIDDPNASAHFAVAINSDPPAYRRGAFTCGNEEIAPSPGAAVEFLDRNTLSTLWNYAKLFEMNDRLFKT